MISDEPKPERAYLHFWEAAENNDKTALFQLDVIYKDNLGLYAVLFGYKNVVAQIMEFATPNTSVYTKVIYAIVTRNRLDILNQIVTENDVDVSFNDNRLIKLATEFQVEDMALLLIRHGASSRALHEDDERNLLGDPDNLLSILTPESVAADINTAKNTVDYYVRSTEKSPTEAMKEAPDFLKSVFLQMFT